MRIINRFSYSLVSILLFSFIANCQTDTIFNGRSPRRTVTVQTTDGRRFAGLIQKTDSAAVYVYSGKFRDWRRKMVLPIQVLQYDSIYAITARRRVGKGMLRGIGIGAALGSSPVIGAAFGPSIGQGAGYVMIITFPLGVLTGGIAGALDKRRFVIDGDKSRFLRFVGR